MEIFTPRGRWRYALGSDSIRQRISTRSGSLSIRGEFAKPCRLRYQRMHVISPSLHNRRVAVQRCALLPIPRGIPDFCRNFIRREFGAKLRRADPADRWLRLHRQVIGGAAIVTAYFGETEQVWILSVFSGIMCVLFFFFWGNWRVLVENTVGGKNHIEDVAARGV